MIVPQCCEAVGLRTGARGRDEQHVTLHCPDASQGQLSDSTRYCNNGERGHSWPVPARTLKSNRIEESRSTASLANARHAVCLCGVAMQHGPPRSLCNDSMREGCQGREVGERAERWAERMAAAAVAARHACHAYSSLPWLCSGCLQVQEGGACGAGAVDKRRHQVTVRSLHSFNNAAAHAVADLAPIHLHACTCSSQ
jgi:hypothetical protein